MPLNTQMAQTQVIQLDWIERQALYLVIAPIIHWVQHYQHWTKREHKLCHQMDRGWFINGHPRRSTMGHSIGEYTYSMNYKLVGRWWYQRARQTRWSNGYMKRRDSLDLIKLTNEYSIIIFAQDYARIRWGVRCPLIFVIVHRHKNASLFPLSKQIDMYYLTVDVTYSGFKYMLAITDLWPMYKVSNKKREQTVADGTLESWNNNTGHSGSDGILIGVLHHVQSWKLNQPLKRM